MSLISKISAIECCCWKNSHPKATLFLDASLNSCVQSVMQKSTRLFLFGGCIDS